MYTLFNYLNIHALVNNLIVAWDAPFNVVILPMHFQIKYIGFIEEDLEIIFSLDYILDVSFEYFVFSAFWKREIEDYYIIS